MHRLRYSITSLSPLLFPINVGDTNMVATIDYIPGSAIMGFFAGRLIQKKPISSDAHKDNSFRSWFLKGALRFTNAYIVAVDKDGNFHKNFPIPLSVQQEKDDESRIHDLLYADEDFENQTSIIEGFGRIEAERLYKKTVKKSLNFHHQRDPNTGTSKKGIIFNYESIDADQIFEGNILGGKEDLKEFLNLFKGQQVAYLGRSKNAQYGKVSFKIISESPEEFVSEMDAVETGSGKISLTLLSNTIIHNSNGFPTTDTKELERQLGDSIKIERSFIRTGDIESFVSVWRLKKPSEICFLAGSCFLVEIHENAKDRLLELQKNGIGERRGEGFGRIVFGWQKEDELKKDEIKEKKPEKPTGDIPDKTKEIIQTIVKESIKGQIELNALQEVKWFIREEQKDKGLPSKSLIGRLEAMSQALSKDGFCSALNELRKPAKDKLEKCNNKRQTLFEFLKSKQFEADIEKIKKDLKVENLCKEAHFTPESDTGYIAELYKAYLSTFFSSMRTILKKGGS